MFFKSRSFVAVAFQNIEEHDFVAHSWHALYKRLKYGLKTPKIEQSSNPALSAKSKTTIANVVKTVEIKFVAILWHKRY